MAVLYDCPIWLRYMIDCDMTALYDWLRYVVALHAVLYGCCAIWLPYMTALYGYAIWLPYMAALYDSASCINC